jgi:ABC-2 type transport system ATP-binding protein
MQKPPIPNSEPIIQTVELTKQFGNVQALKNLNLNIMPGEVYGLLGPNGAGKTTAIKTILGLIEPTSGSVRVCGCDPVTDPVVVKSKIGYMAENPVVYDSLSPRDFLTFSASIRKVTPAVANDMIDRLVKAFDLSQYFDSPIATLSLGMKQKVSLIAALIHRPPVLLLDEPLNGLDAKSSRIVKDLVSFHAQNGGAVLFSTHIMEVAEHVCTRVGIIDKGNVIAEGTVDQLRSKAGLANENLEGVFLKLTHEESEVADTSRMLKEAFFKT